MADRSTFLVRFPSQRWADFRLCGRAFLLGRTDQRGSEIISLLEHADFGCASEYPRDALQWQVLRHLRPVTTSACHVSDRVRGLPFETRGVFAPGNERARRVRFGLRRTAVSRPGVAQSLQDGCRNHTRCHTKLQLRSCGHPSPRSREGPRSRSGYHPQSSTRRIHPPKRRESHEAPVSLQPGEKAASVIRHLSRARRRLQARQCSRFAWAPDMLFR
jgi:hypothetical protein